MIIYNVTINIEEEVHEEWLSWMKRDHIPAVMNTGLFLENRICKVITTDPEETGHTYAIQYSCTNMNDLEEYQKDHGPKLQQEHTDKYAGKFVAFRTLLSVV